MNQYCESCKYFCRINDAKGVCCVDAGPYKDLPYERKACRHFEFDDNVFSGGEK